MPATADREKLIAELERKELEPKSHHTMKIAHQTIANMQARLNHKEEVLKKYQHLLEKAREVFCHAAFRPEFFCQGQKLFSLKVVVHFCSHMILYRNCCFYMIGLQICQSNWQLVFVCLPIRLR